MDHLTAPGHHGDGTGQLVVVDELLHDRVDSLELLDRNPHLLWGGGLAKGTIVSHDDLTFPSQRVVVCLLISTNVLVSGPIDVEIF